MLLKAWLVHATISSLRSAGAAVMLALSAPVRPIATPNTPEMVVNAPAASSSR